FYVRARTRPYLVELEQRFQACATGAAQATGCRATVTPEPFTYDPLRRNDALAERFRGHLAALGVAEDPPASRPALASSAVGNVSQALPTIHPWIGILAAGQPGIAIHTREFRDAAASDLAHERMRAAAGALALTALDVLSDGGLLAAARAEFEAS